MEIINEEIKRNFFNKGITLIALVITIIVLLILAGVAIATLTGDNGILNQAGKAKDKTTEAEAIERVQVGVLGSYGADGNLDNDTLKNNLNNINGITGVPDRIEDTSFPLMVTVDGVDIQITKEGKVSDASLIYVKNGLVLQYDGILNTRNGNNPNATSWEDLSGNNNDGILYNININQETVTDLDTGYYSKEEKGYVFLKNNSYVMSTNNIGISGDANFTIETVSNIWKNEKNPNYSVSWPYAVAVWWGSNNAEVGRVCVFSYDRNSYKFCIGFINNSAYSEKNYDLTGKTSYKSFRKTKVGQIKKEDTDIGKINYNGQDIPNIYKGGTTFTTNLVDSKVNIGRDWRWR